MSRKLGHFLSHAQSDPQTESGSSVITPEQDTVVHEKQPLETVREASCWSSAPTESSKSEREDTIQEEEESEIPRIKIQLE
jgi:hypothetical protein